MCGIAGVVGRRRVNLHALTAMNAAQRHRGPDGEDTWVSDDGRVGFGHTRLAIIDLSEAGHQPMVDPLGRTVITYNGEIYNYIELRAELQALGSRFRSDSDTEVILEAYHQWGERCVERFVGMYAFAIYDAARGRVFLARDRYGEKPLLIARGGDFVAFASEYKALLPLEGVRNEVDEIAILRACNSAGSGLDDGRQTVFRGIEQLLPSESAMLDVETLELEVRRYWEAGPDPDAARLSEKDAVARFRELLTDSVRIRMRSDVPVGSCLSGGLDSASIVCIARQLVGDDANYHTFTGRFPGTSADEWDYAKLVVDRAHTEAHVVEPTVERFFDDLDAFVWHNELPVATTSQFAQWCVFHLATQHGVTVLLDGQGADELLGGYEQYFNFYLEGLREQGRKAELRAEKARIAERYPGFEGRLRGRLIAALAPFAVRHRIAQRLGQGTNMLYGLELDVARRITKLNERQRDPRFSLLGSTLREESFGRFLTTLLRYGDRNSMAHSREVRLPFCDHRLAELVFSLPPEYLMGEAQTKRLLRQSMVGILPDEIRTRWRKQGFLPPQVQWFQGALFEVAETIFNDPAFGRDTPWYAPWWRNALVRFRDGETALAWAFWGPVITHLWKARFVDRARALPPVNALEVS